MPVSALLGGALRDRIAVCYPVFRLRSADQVPAALDRVDDKFGEGFDVIRFYVGTDHAADVAFLTGFADRFAAGSGSSRSTSRTCSGGARRSRRPNG